MKHFGDITKIHGYDVPPVDVITGGSPCQDLSVAGNRAGLAGERSGLFMDQIRIVKEMRDRDRSSGRTGWLIRPRYMVWENVPGAFSSNKGKDFQAVLTEIVKVAVPDAPDVPMPEGGRWTKAGCLYDELGRWSVAWRVHDAQFWGVPQRRKRIALVADFGGLSAPEILFERKGLSGDFEQSGAPRQETTGGTGKGTESASLCLTGWDCQSKRIYNPDGVCGTLNAGTNEGVNIVPSVQQETISFQERAGKPGGAKESCCNLNIQEPCQQSTTNQCLTIGADVYNQTLTGETATTVTAATGVANASGPKVITAGFDGSKGCNAGNIGYAIEQAGTTTTSGGALPNTIGSLCASDYKGVGNQYVNEGKCIIQ